MAMRSCFLQNHERVSVSELLQSTEKVTVNSGYGDQAALFNSGIEHVVITEDFRATKQDLERAAWAGERTLILADRALTFWPS